MFCSEEAVPTQTEMSFPWGVPSQSRPPKLSHLCRGRVSSRYRAGGPDACWDQHPSLMSGFQVSLGHAGLTGRAHTYLTVPCPASFFRHFLMGSRPGSWGNGWSGQPRSGAQTRGRGPALKRANPQFFRPSAAPQHTHPPAEQAVGGWPGRGFSLRGRSCTNPPPAQKPSAADSLFQTRISATSHGSPQPPGSAQRSLESLLSLCAVPGGVVLMALMLVQAQQRLM